MNRRNFLQVVLAALIALLANPLEYLAEHNALPRTVPPVSYTAKLSDAFEHDEGSCMVWAGEIDHWRIHDYTLTPEQIQREYRLNFTLFF